MLTDDQEKQVDTLLDELSDAGLVLSHNSINISYKQMLNYIDKIRRSVPPGDIRDLFETYWSMAQLFYTQFELSLLGEIKKRKDTQVYADNAINSIGGLQKNSSVRAVLEQAVPLLAEDRDRAVIEYSSLLKDYPSLLQSALDKLRDEWQRLNAFSTANRALLENEKLDKSLRAVVEVAAHSVGVQAERIVIVPGNAFALYFFTYKDNLAVLTVPIYSVQSFWEWSIFWHELAGYKVRRLEKNATFEVVRKKLTAFHDLYKISDEAKRSELINSITWDNQFCKNYIQGVFRQERPNLEDLGGFEHQFERMATTLLSTEKKLQTYDQIRADGWSVDWFKELFEDAWSVLIIGKPFIRLFSDILARNVSKDIRHPPKEIRLSVAKELLKLIDPQNAEENVSNSVERYTAQQILKFMSLLRAAERQYVDPSADEETQGRLVGQGIRDELLKKVSARIQRAITSWSDKFVVADDPSRKITNNTRNFLDAFSDEALEGLLLRLDQYETKQTKISYKDLLKGRDYKQLLQLSFSEVDYHTGEDIALSAGGQSYWMNFNDWNNLGRGPAIGNLLVTEILVTEVVSTQNWKIKIADWMSASKKIK